MELLYHKTISTSLGSIELITASHSTHHFPRHFHETFPFGLITNGVLGFHYRGEKLNAWRGSINLANPGEIHDGYPLSENGWQYRMFYVDIEFIQRISGIHPFPWFSTGVIYNPVLAAKIARCHTGIENGSLNSLGIETELAMLLHEMISRYAQWKPVTEKIDQNHQCLRELMEEMRECCALTFNLQQLADRCGYSVGYFLRAFKAASGLTPHQYQIVCRMERARAQLLKQRAISEVAVESGFYDQSHFYKAFRQFYGYTPAALQLS